MDRQVASDAGGGELRRHGDLLGEDPLDEGHALGPHSSPSSPSRESDRPGRPPAGRRGSGWQPGAAFLGGPRTS